MKQQMQKEKKGQPILVTLFSVLVLLLSACHSSDSKETILLAKKIQQDQTLCQVDSMARSIIRQGFNAGSGYSQIWARDMNTFIETACQESDTSSIREAILLFFALQQPNGEMIDGYVLKPDFNWHDDTPYYTDLAPQHVAFKNTVETDQETSLIQLLSKYIRATGDKALLQTKVGDYTVLERIEQMIAYLYRERYSEKYGLIYGAMTADWGDVQPNDDFGCDYNTLSTPCIDVYDNAMLIIALRNLYELTGNKKWVEKQQQIAHNVRAYLWDATKKQFLAHLYLGESPIPVDFDESQVYYHGGTAVAIEAGLLTSDEVKVSYEKMKENVRLSGMPSIGLTLYPPYPKGFFHGGMSEAYIYQNGGDWTWFGGRMVQQLVEQGYVSEAYEAIRPMLDRVLQHKGFYEWYGLGNKPSGSGHFKGSAGVLVKAISLLKEWSEKQL